MIRNHCNNIDRNFIPRSVIERYPRYYRKVRELLGADIFRISSNDISGLMGLTPSQVRKDFSFLGGVGQQGYGYNVKDLYSALGNIIGVFENYTAVIVGGRKEFAAFFASLPFFSSRGVTLKYIFTADGDFGYPMRVVDGIEAERDTEKSDNYVERAAKYIKKEQISIAVLLCEKSEVCQTVQTIVSSGVLGIWNLTGADVLVPPEISLESFNLVDSLFTLCCDITQRKK